MDDDPLHDEREELRALRDTAPSGYTRKVNGTAYWIDDLPDPSEW